MAPRGRGRGTLVGKRESLGQENEHLSQNAGVLGMRIGKSSQPGVAGRRKSRGTDGAGDPGWLLMDGEGDGRCGSFFGMRD